MLKSIVCLLLLGISTAAFSEDARSLYLRGAEADKAGQYQDALGLYTQARDLDSTYWTLDRAIGTCQVRLGLLHDAADSFDRYLAKKPDDTALAAYNQRLKANLSPTSAGSETSTAASATAKAVDSGVDGVTVFLKDNPRDHKHFRIGLELLTPLVFGVDLGYQHDRVNDFGLGWVGYSSGNFGLNLFHPRWRAHSARFYWDSFFELGALIGGAKQKEDGIYGGPPGDYSAMSVLGGDIGMGVDLVTYGPWVFGFLLSLNVVSLSSEIRTTTTHSHGYYGYGWDPYCGCNGYTWIGGPSTTDTTTTNSSILIAYPLIGMNMGLSF